MWKIPIFHVKSHHSIPSLKTRNEGAPEAGSERRDHVKHRVSRPRLSWISWDSWWIILWIIYRYSLMIYGFIWILWILCLQMIIHRYSDILWKIMDDLWKIHWSIFNGSDLDCHPYSWPHCQAGPAVRRPWGLAWNDWDICWLIKFNHEYTVLQSDVWNFKKRILTPSWDWYSIVNIEWYLGDHFIWDS